MDSFKIGDLAKAVNLKIDTIRYYEKIGLIPAPERQDNEYRVYSERYVDILGFIKICKSNGFTLKEISEIMNLLKGPHRDRGHLESIVTEKIKSVDKKVKELEVLKKQLAEILEYCNLEESCTLIDFLKD